MIKARTLQDLFKRYRLPGDLAYAVIWFAFSVFLLISLPQETSWASGTKFLAQPAFWPYAAVIAMLAFSGLHLVSSLISERLEGRWAEIAHWLKSFEFAAWFLAYVVLVPRIGYLPATLLFTVILALRLGYRSPRMLGAAALFGLVVVVVFKSLLRVNVPGGAAYALLPPGLARCMLTYF